MLLRLLLVFVTVNMLEWYLLFRLAILTSFSTTLVLVLLTGLIGSWMAKREGTMAWRKFHEALASGKMPGDEIQNGLMIVFAAALLLTPGLLTDAFGFFLLTSIGRGVVRRHVLPRFFRGVNVVQVTSSKTFESAYQESYDDPTVTVEGKATRK